MQTHWRAFLREADVLSREPLEIRLERRRSIVVHLENGHSRVMEGGKNGGVVLHILRVVELDITSDFRSKCKDGFFGDRVALLDSERDDGHFNSRSVDRVEMWWRT